MELFCFRLLCFIVLLFVLLFVFNLWVCCLRFADVSLDTLIDVLCWCFTCFVVSSCLLFVCCLFGMCGCVSIMFSLLFASYLVFINSVVLCCGCVCIWLLI